MTYEEFIEKGNRRRVAGHSDPACFWSLLNEIEAQLEDALLIPKGNDRNKAGVEVHNWLERARKFRTNAKPADEDRLINATKRLITEVFDLEGAA